jgi:carboxymethylenebutenolidase
VRALIIALLSLAEAPAPGGPPVPAEVTYATVPGPLRGFLYRPVGPGPFPALVFNHGSEREATDLRGQAMFYVPRGFVVFVPHRRGQGLSAGAGEYFDQVWQRTGRQPGKLVELLEAQVDDVAAAVAYVRRLPYVEGNRVALAGCSFGGIEALLAAERDLGLRAAIDFAGGAIIWSRNPPLQERMKRAARGARVPVFFLQAQNDFDTAPSRVLSEEMRRAGRPYRMKIFPPKGTTPMDGHSFCAGGPAPPWGPDVLGFLRDNRAAP